MHRIFLLIILLGGCRTIKDPSDKKTRFIFVNETNQNLTIYGFKNNKEVKNIFIEKTSSYIGEVITPKTFATESELFNYADSSTILFVNGKKLVFTISNLSLFLKCPLVPNNYSFNKINDNYLETTYKITNEFLDSAR